MHTSQVSRRSAGGSEQETRIQLIFENWKEREGANGTLSKTKIIYEHPFEVRFTTYLIIDNRDRPNDQFIYLNSRRRVRRVNLRGENLFGTDFSFEDVVPKELEDSTYTRKPDATVQGGVAPSLALDSASSTARSERARATNLEASASRCARHRSQSSAPKNG